MPRSKVAFKFRHFYERTVNMPHRSLDAFVSRDAEAARKISDEDDSIDQLYD